MDGWKDTLKPLKVGYTRICPHCLKEYMMGIDGTIHGCDRCEGIVRLPNGMIDWYASSPEVFAKREEHE